MYSLPSDNLHNTDCRKELSFVLSVDCLDWSTVFTRKTLLLGPHL